MYAPYQERHKQDIRIIDQGFMVYAVNLDSGECLAQKPTGLELMLTLKSMGIGERKISNLYLNRRRV